MRYPNLFFIIYGILTFFVLSKQLHAASFTVPAGQTNNTAQTLANGETGTIENTGVLSVNGSVAVTMRGGSTLNNAGTTDGSGSSTIGGSNAGTTNPVLITNTGSAPQGILKSAGGTVIDFQGINVNLTINNSGQISGNQFGGSTQLTTINNAVNGVFNMGEFGPITGNNLQITNSGTFTGNIVPTFSLTFTNNATGRFNGSMDVRGVETTINNFGIIGDSIIGEFRSNNTSTVLINNSNAITFSDYQQSLTTTLSQTINNTSSFGRLQINGTPAFAAGTTLKIVAPADNTIVNGDTFDIITSAVNPLPQISDFNVDMTGVASNVTFTLTRPTPFIFRLLAAVQDLSTTTLNRYITFDGLRPLAQRLDSLCAQNPRGELLQVCQALHRLTGNNTMGAVESIAVDPNGASVLATLYNQTQIFLKVDEHLDQRLAKVDLPLSGYIAGDHCDDDFGFRPLIFGNIQRHKELQTVEGFRANTQGLGLLMDKSLADQLIVGLGVTYATTTVRQLEFQNTTSIRSLQGLAYAAYGFCQWFADGILGFASNHYRNNHTLIFGTPLTSTAYGNYHGFQTSGKIRVGYQIPICNTELSPILSLLQVRLRQNAYTETGAFVLNQAIETRRNSLLQGGAGLRWSYTQHCENFYPEIHAFYLRNFRQPALQVTSAFLIGGGAFTTFAPNIPRNSYNLGLSVSTLLTNAMSLAVSYDLETRKRYFSNSATLRFLWSF